MSPNMLEWPMPAISIPTVHLNSPIGSFSTQPICPVIAHRYFITNLLLYLHVRHAVHFHGRLADEKSKHLALCCKLDEWKLNALVVGEGCTEGGALVGIFNGLLHAIDGSAEGGGSLSDTVLVHKGLRDTKAVVDRAENGAVGDPYVFY